MRWFRFKIRSIIGLIVICGVALAALKESTDLWEKGVFSFTLLILLLSVLFAVHRRGASQAFWLGFALFGSVYLGLSLIPPIESRLISSQGLGYLHYRLPGQSAQNVVLTITTPTVGTMNVPTGSIASSPGGGQGQLRVSTDGLVRVWHLGSGRLMATWGGSKENFVAIGHTLLALVMAWIGGMVSRRLASAEQAHEDSAPAASSSTVDPERLAT